jgi:hypothetical protein
MDKKDEEFTQRHKVHKGEEGGRKREKMYLYSSFVYRKPQVRRAFVRCLLVCGISLFMWGCVSLMEKSGQALDGSAFAEKTVAVYRTAKNAATAMEIREVENKAGERSVIIMPGNYPSIKFCGSVPDENGEFQLTSLDYLGGNTSGWNEYRLDISGSGTMTPSVTSLSFSINPDIETLQISSGKIRRFDTRIIGNEALASLGNRRERIIAVAEWMKGYEGSDGAEDGTPAGSVTPGEADRDAFEKYWKPILFPELVSRSKRPADWQREGDQWNRAEDIRWNTSYTERVFPELLRQIRNTGTMLRDWEEALEWLFVEYEWDRITETLSHETVLGRVKR